MSARDDIVIRPLEGAAELQRCVELQRLTWGPGFDEVVPPAILWVAGRTGGIAAGAFDSRGRMLGFVFGVSGWRDGRPVHWSDMLAVVPEARNLGLGRRLKLYQYTALREAGIHHVGWTFEPLESRNAHLNFARFGITCHEYVRDCYGDPTSPLHAGLGTDRLVAHWQLDSERVRSRMEAGADAVRPNFDWAGCPLVNDGADAEPRLDLSADVVRIRIPADVQALKRRAATEATRWRRVTRASFEHFFGQGYVAEELVRECEQFSSYLLFRRRPPLPGPTLGVREPA